MRCDRRGGRVTASGGSSVAVEFARDRAARGDARATSVIAAVAQLARPTGRATRRRTSSSRRRARIVQSANTTSSAVDREVVHVERHRRGPREAARPACGTRRCRRRSRPVGSVDAPCRRASTSRYASTSAASHACDAPRRTPRARRRRSTAHDERRIEPVDERAQPVAHVGVELGRAGERLGRLRRVRARDGQRRVDDVGLGDERDDRLDLGPFELAAEQRRAARSTTASA